MPSPGSSTNPVDAAQQYLPTRCSPTVTCLPVVSISNQNPTLLDDEPRDRYCESRSYSDRRSPASSRQEDLRIPFERFGPVKDVYLPKNYHTGEPRGFGFVKYRYAEDAAEAKQQLNHTVIGGREIRIVFAEENRKTPQEMRTSSRVSGRYGGSRRRTPPRSPRRRYHSYSRSPTPARRDSRDHGARDDYRSPSLRDEGDYRRSPSPRENGQSPHAARGYAPSRSLSPRGKTRSPSRSRSRSYSPR